MSTFQFFIRRQAWAALLLFLYLASSGCSTSALVNVISGTDETGERPPDSARVYTIFLVGDAGAPMRGQQEPSLKLLQEFVEETGERGAVVFLGDNIYPSGMPPAASPERNDAERRINAQLDVVKDHAGEIVFVPGNHDWGGAGLGGNRAALRRQEVYVEQYLDRGNTFVPDRGFPGPVEIELAEDIMLVAIDTQWWLEDYKPYGNTGTYQLEQEGEFLLELDDVLHRNSDKHLVVVAHHPVFSNGEHGGQFRGLRSLLTGERVARAYLGTPQDMSNLKYRQLRDALLSVFQHHEDLVFAAGHDHGLQYFKQGDQHYVVSGSASKLGHIESGRGASFAADKKGFADLRYYTDGSIWLTFYEPRGDGSEGESLYVDRIREPSRPLVAVRDIVAPSPDDVPVAEDAQIDGVVADTSGRGDNLAFRSAGSDTLQVREQAEIDATPVRLGPLPTGTPLPEEAPYNLVTQGSITVSANRDYDRGAFKRMILGEHYRDIWAMPVTVPIIDLSRTAGGLTVIRKGGGLQTVSLRFLGADGDQYVLRSVDKDPRATIPYYLRRTIAQDVVQDQVAAMHPYGATIIPRLARAAGVYHTHPTVVSIPDDERLGIYRPLFAGMLALFETRPDEDQSDEARFGYAENVIGTPRLFENIQEDNDERVDERAFARARLLDMMIGDWDRHKDQWRWAEFDVTPGKIFKPVPRDRDFALFKFDGFFPNLVKKAGNIAFRRFTNFFRGYEDILGLNYNGAAMDRRFTSDLSKDDWLEIADSLRAAITDEVIEEAVRDFPDAVYQHQGSTIARLLKERRDKLPDAAAEYYRLLAKNIDVVGSDKHERFEVSRLSDDSTLVVMYKTSKEGEIDREYYRRIVLTSETEEVRLYGLDGNDQFIVTGEVGDGIRVRAIGGQGEDTFVDRSSVRGASRHTIFHDTEEGNEWTTTDETNVIRSNDPRNNEYRMLRYELDERHPLIHVSRNVDDGILVGGGIKFVKHGFRRDPYAAEHRFTATAATQRRAFNAHYRGRFIETYGPWDGRIEADARADRSFRNFYGMGNETDLADRDFFRARLGGVNLYPSLERNIFPFTNIRLGPRFEFMTVERPLEPQFLAATRFSDDDFVDKYFAGAEFEFDVDGTDTLAATLDGVKWLNSVRATVGVRHTNKVFVRLASEVSYFYTFYLPTRLTIGVRGGGATNIGDFEFFQANTLGGQSNLRGFRKTRFAGHTAVYTNVDVRIQLIDFNIYLVRGIGGVLAFFDNGRVWAKGDDSSFWKWHQGYGGGVWIAPFDQFAMTATIGVSKENTLFDLSFGFQF